jgi:hypothetical protein
MTMAIVKKGIFNKSQSIDHAIDEARKCNPVSLFIVAQDEKGAVHLTDTGFPANDMALISAILTDWALGSVLGG